ncbi:MAG: type IX secretion system membrane protein PorP/SprF, partial [Bacteroidota bacterium]
MKLIRYSFIVLLVSVASFAQAQNPINHFSLFDFTPLTLNPAQTGAYEGSVRIGGLYRDQWRSFL